MAQSTSAPSLRSSALVAFAAVALAHGLALLAGFAWDDQHTVLANPALRSAEGLLRALGRDDWGAYGLRVRGLYRPLATLSLALDHALFGFRAWGYHLTNLGLHAFTAFAAMRALGAAGVRAAPALLAGALFAVHPLGSEVADWISARPDVLAAALVMAAVWAAVSDRPLLAALLAGAAPFAKEPGLAALPAALAVVALRAPRRDLLRAIAISAVALAGYLVARRVASAAGPGPSALALATLPAAVGRLGAVAAGWISAFLFPLPLDAARRIPELGLWRWPCAALAIAGPLLLAARSGRQRAALAPALAILWLVPLLLVAGWAPNLSERYLYLPSLGAALALGLAGDRAAATLARLPPRAARAAVAACALLLAASAWSSAARAREWADPLALFAGAVVADPGNAEAWRLLGAERYRRGDRRGALEAFERSALLGSAQAGLYSNLCAVRREGGDLQGAQADCDRAVALDPMDPRPRYNRALLYAAQGRSEAALAELRSLAADFPGYGPARSALRAAEGQGR